MGFRRWLLVLGRVSLRVFPDQLSLIAAGIAFYALLAIFPAVAALVALAGLFANPDAVVSQLQIVTELLPDQAAAIVLDQARRVAGASTEGLSWTLIFGVGFAIYLSTRATSGLLYGLNVVWRTAESRTVFHLWTLIILMTAALLVAGVVVLLLLLGLPAVLAIVPLDIGTKQLLQGSRWAVVAVVAFFGIALLYRWGPSQKHRRRQIISAGSVLAWLLWFAGSLGFAAYVANFGQYNEVFGSLGGVIILLTWIWLSAFIVLLGALLDAEVAAEIKSSRFPEEPHFPEHSASNRPSN